MEQGSQVPTPPPLTMAVSPSSTTSKLHVSVAPSKSGVNGGTLSRRPSQSRPKKKGCFWKSPAPFRPSRVSGGHSSRWMRSRASSGTPASASGRERCSCSEGAGERGCQPGRGAEGWGSRGSAHLVVHDLAVGLSRGVGVEGRLPVEHFIGEHAQGPPVTLGAVAVRPRPAAHGLQDLGGQVVGGAHSHQRPNLSQQNRSWAQPRPSEPWPRPF